MAYTLSVFMENKPSKLESVTALLARDGVNIRGLNVTSGGEFGVVKLLVDDPVRAYAALSAGKLSVARQEAVIALLPDAPGEFHRLLLVLAKNGINIEDCYGFVLENGRKAAFVIDVDEPARVEEVLRQNGIQTLDETAFAAH